MVEKQNGNLASDHFSVIIVRVKINFKMKHIRRSEFLISAFILSFPISEVQISNLKFYLLGFEKDERMQFT